MFGSGSGIWRIKITAYKFGKPPWQSSLSEIVYPAYSNVWFPGGFAALKMARVNDTQIRLYGGTVKNGEISFTEDYGFLRCDGSRLVPSDMEKFPYAGMLYGKN